MRFLACIATSLVVVVAATSAWAQAGWYLTPSLSLTEEYDDNVSGQASGRKSDFVTRVTGSLSLGYHSAPFTLLGAYSVGAEVFADNSDLNGIANRQQGTFSLSYLPTPLLTLRTEAFYRRSETSTVTLQTPAAPGIGDAQPGTATPEPPGAGSPPEAPPVGATEVGAPPPGSPAVEFGRRKTRVIAVTPSASYAFTPRTLVQLSYSYSQTEVSDGSAESDVGTDPTTRAADMTDSVHEAGLGIVQQLTPLVRATTRYRLRRFESDEADSTTSHIVTLGLRRPLLTDRTHVSLEAGPRFSDGDVGVEASARLEHQFRFSTISLGYTRSQGVVAGRSGAQTTDTGTVGLVYQPFRPFQASLTGSVLRAEEEAEAGLRVLTSYRAAPSLAYRLMEWAVIRAVYSFSLQEQGSETIRHHIVSISLDLTYLIRLD